MAKNIVILTGAGISAESGLQTFRAEDGLWCDHRVEDVATPEAFARNPQLVQDFYNMRRGQLKEVEPNAAHQALAELEAGWDGEFLLVTQNVDDLHDRARQQQAEAGKLLPVNDNVPSLIHMHGELTQIRCTQTDRIFEWHEDITPDQLCDCCRDAGTLRPHIVWFGEMPLQMDRIYRALSDCDIFISIGTSGQVYPAAGFVQEAKAYGARTVELNLEPTGNPLFDEGHYGPATEVVGDFVKGL